jgi:hypothetical protein
MQAAAGADDALKQKVKVKAPKLKPSDEFKWYIAKVSTPVMRF